MIYEPVTKIGVPVERCGAVCKMGSASRPLPIPADDSLPAVTPTKVQYFSRSLVKCLASRPVQLALAVVLVTAAAAEAKIKPNALISDNAVLRRGARIPVWGTTDSNEPVTVRFAGQQQTANPERGRFRVELEELKPGGPHEMTIRQGNTQLRLKNILVGDVWLCGGQSNMQWPLAGTTGAQQAIANSANNQIRLFTVKRDVNKRGATTPEQDVEGSWLVCGPETVPGFSAVAYYFARDL